MAVVGLGLDDILAVLDFINIKKVFRACKRKWGKHQISDELRNDFSGYYPNPHYIPLFFSVINANKAEHDDPRPLLDYLLSQVLESKAPRHYLLLGDAGTGKTAALVHLYAKYVQKHPFSDRITLLSLRGGTEIGDIQQLLAKKGKKELLLLDALDENQRARKPDEFVQFCNELSSVCSQFDHVIITCRPQLFESESQEADAIQSRLGEKWSKYNRLRLSDLSERQFETFLGEKYASDPKRLAAAKGIVDSLDEKAKSVFFRPIILTHLDDIVDEAVSHNRKPQNVFEIYDIIVAKQIDRELNKQPTPPRDIEGQRQHWWDITSEVAGYMYQNDKTSLTREELEAIPTLPKNTSPRQRIWFTTRRGNKGHEFLHRSFYEYFMAYRFLLKPDEIGSVYNMDFALQLYGDLTEAVISEKNVRFANLDKLPSDVFARSQFSIGFAFWRIHRYEEAEKRYRQALDTLRQLAEPSPEYYLPNVAEALNGLAALHSLTGRTTEAEKEYNEALDILKTIPDKKRDVYMSLRAGILNNLSIFHSNHFHLNEAIKECKEALGLYRELAKALPYSYHPYVALTLNTLAYLHNRDNRPREAEAEYTEALRIYRELVEEGLEEYQPNMAMALSSMADFHRKNKRPDKAEEEFKEALGIFRKLGDKIPDAYLPSEATTLYGLALLYKDKGDLSAAESAAEESLEKYRKLAEKSHEAFDKDVADAENLLAEIRAMK